MSHEFSYERAEEVKEWREEARVKNRLIVDLAEYAGECPIEEWDLERQERLISLLKRVKTEAVKE